MMIDFGKIKRRVEYYRLWAHGLWDTDYVLIPDSTPEDNGAMDGAIKEAVTTRVWGDGRWSADTPVSAGIYHYGDDDPRAVPEDWLAAAGKALGRDDVTDEDVLKSVYEYGRRKEDILRLDIAALKKELERIGGRAPFLASTIEDMTIALAIHEVERHA